MRLITVPEAAQILAVSSSTVRDLAQRPDFPILRVNAHCHRIDADRLEAWVTANLGKPVPQTGEGHGEPLSDGWWEAELEQLVKESDAPNVLKGSLATKTKHRTSMDTMSPREWRRELFTLLEEIVRRDNEKERKLTEKEKP